MKKLFFAYANFYDPETNQKRTVISDLTESLEKSAYLLYKKMIDIDLEEEDIELNYGQQSFSKKEFNIIKNENLYVPIIRYKCFKDEDFFDYDIFQGFKMDKNQNIKELKSKYISLMKKNKDHIEYMEDMYPDKKYVYLIKYSKDNFSDLEDFINDSNNYYHFLIELELNTNQSLKEGLLEYGIDIEEDLEEEPESLKNKKEILNNIYRNRFINNNEDWTSLSLVIDQIITRQDLYLTIAGKDIEIGTFSEDNKHFIYDYLDNILMENNETEIIVFVRQFTNINMPNTDIPYKRVSAFTFLQSELGFLDKEYLEYISRFNYETGKLMDKEEGVKYLNTEDMLKILNIKLG